MNQIMTGSFIARKRKEKNLTQAALAERFGVSNKTVSKWETGKCMPDYSVIELLCKKLEITVADCCRNAYRCLYNCTCISRK